MCGAEIVRARPDGHGRIRIGRAVINTAAAPERRRHGPREVLAVCRLKAFRRRRLSPLLRRGSNSSRGHHSSSPRTSRADRGEHDTCGAPAQRHVNTARSHLSVCGRGLSFTTLRAVFRFEFDSGGENTQNKIWPRRVFASVLLARPKGSHRWIGRGDAPQSRASAEAWAVPAGPEGCALTSDSAFTGRGSH